MQRRDGQPALERKRRAIAERGGREDMRRAAAERTREVRVAGKDKGKDSVARRESAALADTTASHPRFRPGFAHRAADC